MKYDEKSFTEEDPKTKPKKAGNSYWSTVDMTPVNDANNPTRRVKPSSHMTRLIYSFTVIFSRMDINCYIRFVIYTSRIKIYIYLLDSSTII